MTNNELCHFGIKGQKWGVRRYQNEDGTRTPLGKKRRAKQDSYRNISDVDLRKSTELSEKMDASGFITMLNHFLGEMIEIINSWQGNILSFVGDAIVTVFGAPRENTEAARDAVACAVAMQRRIPAVNEWNAKEGYPALSMGIGIHTGEAILGTIGSQTRAKYDMIGRNVNLASRIEGFTGSGQILISSETMKAAGDLVVVNTAGEKGVQPKGIHEQVLLHDVVGYGSHRIRPEV